MASSSNSTSRPTLPSLHSLDLLPSVRQNQCTDKLNESNDSRTCRPLQIPNWRHLRQVSNSSSNTSASRTPSPSPSHEPVNPFLPNQSKFRLVSCSIESADAVVVVPFTSELQPLPLGVQQQKQGKALLLVGPAMQRVRQYERQIAKSARVHPYRIVHGSSNSRRSSAISTLSV